MNLAEVSKQIEFDAKKLVEKIRQFSKAQKSIWQKIPYLTLQVDRRTGYQEDNKRAYEEGYWPIRYGSILNNDHGIFIDLETGELVEAYNPKLLASDKDVLLLAQSPDRLKAQNIIDTLISQRREAILDDCYDSKKQTSWRNWTKRRYNLKPNRYSRVISPTRVYERNVRLFTLTADTQP